MNQLTTSLWGDESFTAVAVQQNFLRMLEIVAKDTAPPLYYFCLFIWTRIFGHSEIALRSLSLIFYLGTVYLTYLIAKRIWDKKTGFIAALLTLANPFLFPFAFESRMYAILVFFVTMSFYFFIFRNTWGYVLSSAAAIYSHHYAGLALVFQFFWRLIETVKYKNFSKKPVKYFLQFLKPYFLIGLLYLPWLYPLYKQVTMVSQGFWLGKPQFKDLINLYFNYLRGSDFIFKLQKYLFFGVGLILICKNWSKKMKNNLLIVGWAVTPVLLAFIISQGKTSLFYDRYLIFIIPALALLLTGGFKKISLIFIIIYFMPLIYINFHYFTHPTKRPFRQLAEYVRKQAGSYDIIINYNGKAHHLWEAKYYQVPAPLYVPQGELPFYVGTAQMTNKDIIRDLKPYNKIGVIASEEPESLQIENFKLLTFTRFESLSFSWFVKQD